AYNYDVEYELEQTGSTWFLIVSACPEFFQTAQFPVTVDPTITVKQEHMNVGSHHDVGTTVRTNFYVHYPLWGIGGGWYFAYVDLGTERIVSKVSRLDITSASLSINFANSGANFLARLMNTKNYSQLYNNANFIHNLSSTTDNNSNPRRLTVNVTDYVNNRLDAATISIRCQNNKGNDFSSAVLTITYNEFDNPDYNLTQDLGESGAGAVNLNTGALSYTYNDIITTDCNMPISINRIYNEDFADTYKVGYGFKLNIQQKVAHDGSNYYYLSATGKRYYFAFYNQVNTNKELGLRLYFSGSTALIIDLHGNSMLFDMSNNGNLKEIHQYPSKPGAALDALSIVLTYSGNNISEITNNFTTLHFSYTGGYLTKIEDGSFTTLAQYWYTGNKLDIAQKFFTSVAYDTTLTYNGNKISGITSATGDKVQYTYSANKISSVATSNTNNLTGSPVITNIQYTTFTRVFLGLLATMAMDKTTVVTQGDLIRHISFKGSKMISDYTYKNDGGSFIPYSAYSNEVNFMAFNEAYGTAQSIYYHEFNSSTVYNGSLIHPVTFNTIWGTHSYAMGVWVKKIGSAKEDLLVSTNANLFGLYDRDAINSNILDWQFYVYIIENPGYLASFNAAIDCNAGFYIRSIQLIQLPRFTKSQKEEWAPIRNANGQTIASFHYAADNSITSYQYTYGNANGNYLGQLTSITERTGSATLTRAQYQSQATQVSKVVYSYTPYTVSGKTYSFLTSTTTYGSSSASGAPYFTTVYGYDNAGRVTSYTDKNDVVTEYNYDPLTGAITATVLEDVLLGTGTSTTNQYQQGTGSLLSTTTGGITTNFGYNSWGGLETISQNGFTTCFNYNSEGGLQSISVAGQQLVNYTYSDTQNIIEYSNWSNLDPFAMQSVKYNYDANGYLTSMENEMNNIANFNYSNNQLSSVSHANGVNYNYAFNSQNAASSYEMTNAGNTFRAEYSNSGKTQSYFLGDPMGGYSLMDYYEHTYNSRGQITGTYRNANMNTQYNYDPMSRPDSKTLTLGANSYKNSYEYYGNNNRVFREQYTINTTKQSDYIYSYYDNGLLQTVYDGKYYPNNWVYLNHYEYDAFGRLAIEYNFTAGKIYQYIYDNGGNILAKHQYDINGNWETMWSYTYSGIWKDQLLAYNGQAITYDEVGNPTLYKGNNLTWQNGRQLATYGSNISYEYDYASIRTSKTVNGVTTNYYLEGSRIWMETTNGQMKWYYYDADGIQGMWSSVYGEYYFERNMFGDVVALWTTSGALAGRYVYDAWGNHTIYDAAGSVINPYTPHAMTANPWRYRGYFYDSETGFFYLNSRYYDPQICRFINADEPVMLFLTAGMPGGANLYAYALNNPIKFVDRTGTMPVPAIGPAWSGSGSGTGYDRIVRPNLSNDLINIIFHGDPGMILLKQYGGAVGSMLTSPFATGMYALGYMLQSFTSVKMFTYNYSFLEASVTGFTIADANFTGAALSLYTSNNHNNNIYLNAVNFSVFAGFAIDGIGLSAQGTILELGYSSSNFDIGILLGSMGWNLKLTQNSLTIGGSYLVGLIFTIRW
ncbi:MAG: RHS repeat-associated core domain-containing protein, partial [Firmicutes bacterium]|nr:RHS repeat-associated core domain-containing protein [Bacillota bacterium]